MKILNSYSDQRVLLNYRTQRRFALLSKSISQTKCRAFEKDFSAKLLKVKGSGAEARAEGPFLRWQNCSGEAAKSAERERRPQPPPPSAGKREVPTSSSSDSAGAESSVTAAKPPQG